MWLDNAESVDPKLLCNNSHQTQARYSCCWASMDGEVLGSPAVDQDRTRPVAGWPLFFNNDFPLLFHEQKNEFPWRIGTAYFFEINDTRFMKAY